MAEKSEWMKKKRQEKASSFSQNYSLFTNFLLPINPLRRGFREIFSPSFVSKWSYIRQLRRYKTATQKKRNTYFTCSRALTFDRKN